MKIIYTLLVFFVLIHVNAQPIYQNDGTIVYKIDSANHVAWARDFSGMVYAQSPDSNKVVGVAFDNKFLYVWVLQSNYTSILNDFYSSVFVIDTNGNLISQKTEHIIYGTKFSSMGFWPALDGGVWMATDYGWSTSHTETISKIDSTGGYSSTDSSLSFHSSTYNYIHSLLTLTDSTYLAVSDYFTDVVPVPKKMSCTNFDEGGKVIWTRDYGSAAQTEEFDLTGVVADSLKNIYLIGNYDDWYSANNGLFAIKLDSVGQILHSHLFTDLRLPLHRFSNNLSIQGSMLYLEYKDTIIQFDTSFTNACLNQAPNFQVDVMASIIDNSPLGNIVFVQSPYQPDTITYNYVPNSTPLYPFYCFSLNDVEIDDYVLNVWPNPVTNIIMIESSSVMKRIGIYDLRGEKIRETSFKDGIYKTEIELELFEAGIYMMIIENGKGERIMKKVLHY